MFSFKKCFYRKRLSSITKETTTVYYDKESEGIKGIDVRIVFLLRTIVNAVELYFEQ